MNAAKALDLVNAALKEAKASEACDNPEATGVSLTIGSRTYSYTFQSGSNRFGLNEGPDGSNFHARRDELARFRLEMVSALLDHADADAEGHSTMDELYRKNRAEADARLVAESKK